MERLLAGKNVLITGGGVGIGRRIASELASAGARLAVTYLTHEPDPDFTDEIKDRSGKPPLILRLDATNEPEVQNATTTLAREFGKIDILVNNAGGLVRRATIAEMDFALWNKVMALNLDSAFLVTHHTIPHMPSGWGRIINVASLAGHNGGHPGAVAYAASKAALLGFTRGLSKELAPKGITVNALAPGFIDDTPFHQTFTTDASKRQTISTIPLGRAGAPADVAGAALWLASPLSDFVTGETVNINGGQYFA